MPYSSGMSPQQKAAYVSAQNRSRRAQEKREREADLAIHVEAHARGDWDGRTIRLGCEHCQKALREAI